MENAVVPQEHEAGQRLAPAKSHVSQTQAGFLVPKRNAAAFEGCALALVYGHRPGYSKSLNKHEKCLNMRLKYGSARMRYTGGSSQVLLSAPYLGAFRAYLGTSSKIRGSCVRKGTKS